MFLRRSGALALAGALLAACSDDGRTMAPAPPTTATSAAPATTGAGDVAEAFAIRSVDLVDGGTIEPRLTCDGAGEPPSFVVTGAPSTAVELAVAVVDLDADGQVQWVVAGLAPALATVDPAALPDGAVQARSGSGALGWEPPCPPAGEGPHRYEVRAYAMAESVGLSSGLDGRDAVELLEVAAVSRATLTASYQRQS